MHHCFVIMVCIEQIVVIVLYAYKNVYFCCLYKQNTGHKSLCTLTATKLQKIKN